jgi:hypothetical protein
MLDYFTNTLWVTVGQVVVEWQLQETHKHVCLCCFLVIQRDRVSTQVYVLVVARSPEFNSINDRSHSFAIVLSTAAKWMQAVHWLEMRSVQLDREDLCQPRHGTSSVMARRCQVIVLRLSNECCLLGCVDALLVSSRKWCTAGKCNLLGNECWSARDDITPLLISQGCLLGVVLL